MVALDAMHQLDRLTVGRNQVKPATGGEAVGGQSQNAVGDGIAVMMVVKQPGFVMAVAQGSLNFGKVHAISIVNDRAYLLRFPSTRSRVAAGNVSQAVRKTSRGVRSRIAIR
jgi:hypothetical protein